MIICHSKTSPSTSDCARERFARISSARFTRCGRNWRHGEPREQRMKHFSEADLLETYYTQPGESMPVMMHLAECSECASRYERLERKVRGLAECEHDKPETFWARQRLSIMRRVQERRAPAFARYAAAAAIVLVLGGVVAYRNEVSESQRLRDSETPT